MTVLSIALIGENSGETKVSYLQVPRGTDKQVCRLQVLYKEKYMTVHTIGTSINAPLN